MNVTLKSDGNVQGTRIHAGDHELRGITGFRFAHDAGDLPKIELELFGASIEVQGRAVFYSPHPVDGDPREVRKIIFADGSEWEAA